MNNIRIYSGNRTSLWMKRCGDNRKKSRKDLGFGFNNYKDDDATY